jgi:small subunit ribosomal protein S20
MANIKSAKKRVSVTAKKTLTNKIRKTNMKNVIKKSGLPVGEATSKEAVIYAIKRIDQAAAHGLIHKNKAGRKKAQLMKLINN